VVRSCRVFSARFLQNGVPFQGGIDGDSEDVAAVALPAHAEVSQTQGGNGMVANLGQSLPAFGVRAQDLSGPGESVQAVEPLADQAGAQEGCWIPGRQA